MPEKISMKDIFLATSKSVLIFISYILLYIITFYILSLTNRALMIELVDFLVYSAEHFPRSIGVLVITFLLPFFMLKVLFAFVGMTSDYLKKRRCN